MEQFKRQLEKDLLIIKWNPTQEQLKEIKNRILQLKEPVKKSDIEKIVFEIYGSYECIVLESVDNSDLSLLLKLASNTND